MSIHDSYVGDMLLDDCSRQKEFQAVFKLKRKVVIGEANWGYLSEHSFSHLYPHPVPKTNAY